MYCNNTPLQPLSRRLDQLPQVTKKMYNNNTPYNHYLVDWINYHR